MANYISSNANRFYAAVEKNYGLAASIGAADRYPALKLQAQQVLQQSRRLDKTGTRTFLGTPKTAKRRTAFAVNNFAQEPENVRLRIETTEESDL